MVRETPKKTVLIVDDHDDFLIVTKDLLESRGYTALTASSGKSALALYKKHEPELVITDLFMAGMSGIELIRNILQLKADQKIIALSGYQDVAKRIEYLGLSMDIGATRFLQKPLEANVLLDTVRRSLRRPSGPHTFAAPAANGDSE